MTTNDHSSDFGFGFYLLNAIAPFVEIKVSLN